MKLRFVQGVLPEDPDMPWIITVRRVPTETGLIASVEWRALHRRMRREVEAQDAAERRAQAAALAEALRRP